MDATLDYLYDVADALMRDGDFAELDWFLADTDPDELPSDVLLGILTATLPAKSRLVNRPEFFAAVQHALSDSNEMEPGLLVGLE